MFGSRMLFMSAILEGQILFCFEMDLRFVFATFVIVDAISLEESIDGWV